MSGYVEQEGGLGRVSKSDVSCGGKCAIFWDKKLFKYSNTRGNNIIVINIENIFNYYMVKLGNNYRVEFVLYFLT